jgi:medium-chain acyl-[acyl-carrier-protein] hydrolase
MQSSLPSGRRHPSLPLPRAAAVRLVCFPFAGGTAQSFRAWVRTPGIEVVAVEYPGRGTRWGEPPPESLGALVGRLAGELPGLWTGGFAFWGHSFGAGVAFELARLLRARGGPLPCRLFVSGARPPHLPSREPIHALADVEFLRELRGFGGMPPEVLAHEELLELMLPILRSDFRLYERHDYRDEPALPIPISAVGGLADVEVPVDEVLEWQRHTSRSFRPRFLPGGHFFAWETPDRVADLLRADLAASAVCVASAR